MSTPESKIQLKILKHLQSKSIYCWRNGNLPRYDVKTRQYLYNPQHKSGVGDIICVHDGKHIEIEVKTSAGKQSPDQKIHQKRIESAGGIYILARDIQDVDKYFA